MKRFVLQILVVTFLAIGGLSGAAQAQHPYYARRVYAAGPAVVVYGGNVGYGMGYSEGYGGYSVYGGNRGYGNNYYGFAPSVAPIYPQSAPYGAGYSGGYQPYQEMYLQRLYYGLGH